MSAIRRASRGTGPRRPVSLCEEDDAAGPWYATIVVTRRQGEEGKGRLDQDKERWDESERKSRGVCFGQRQNTSGFRFCFLEFVRSEIAVGRWLFSTRLKLSEVICSSQSPRDNAAAKDSRYHHIERGGVVLMCAVVKISTLRV